MVFSENIVAVYMRSFKDKISLENVKSHPKFLFIQNLLETPKFTLLPLEVIQIYGHEESSMLDGPLVSTFNKYLVSFEKSFFNTTKDEKIITMLAESSFKETLYISHVFLKSRQPIQIFTGPAKSALFFLTNEIPSKERIEKFYHFTIDGFLANEYENIDENLKPIACIDLNQKEKYEDYDEYELQKNISGKYLLTIIKHNSEENTMILDVVNNSKNKNSIFS